MDERQTLSLKDIAAEYVRLGGQRRAVIDDNKVSTRKWDSEPAAAQAFWERHVSPLSDKDLQELETYLPTINRR